MTNWDKKKKIEFLILLMKRTNNISIFIKISNEMQFIFFYKEILNLMIEYKVCLNRKILMYIYFIYAK